VHHWLQITVTGARVRQQGKTPKKELSAKM
jgi:hypothetical protein